MVQTAEWPGDATPTKTDATVAIVGFGPTGAVLAGLLGAANIDVIVIEHSVDVFPLPRAAHIDHTGLRSLQALGCLDDLLPGMIDNPGLDFVAADGSVLMQIPSDQRSVSGLPTSMYFHQPVFDRAIRANVAKRSSVRILTGTTLVSCTQDSDGVLLDVMRDGVSRQIRAAWLVGCDGATSTVREGAGITLEDLNFDEQWLVVDLVLDRPMAALPTRALAVCDPARPTTLIPMPGHRFRFEFMLLPGEDPAVMQRESVVLGELLTPWISGSGASVERAAVYAFHGLLAQSWRTGRVLLAGDAAHQMPPFLGQGMNSGIRDAANLAWKLEHVLTKQAPPELLDTYAIERRAHVRSIIEAAVEFGRLICVLDPAEAERRNRWLLESGFSPRDRARFRLPRLMPGPLIHESGGELFPQPAGKPGERFDDLMGRRFAVLHRSGSSTGPALDWWQEQGAFVAGLDKIPDNGWIHDWLDAHQADSVIVRPDRYVLFAGRTLAALSSAVNRLLSAAEPVSPAP